MQSLCSDFSQAERQPRSAQFMKEDKSTGSREALPNLSRCVTSEKGKKKMATMASTPTTLAERRAADRMKVRSEEPAEAHPYEALTPLQQQVLTRFKPDQPRIPCSEKFSDTSVTINPNGGCGLTSVNFRGASGRITSHHMDWHDFLECIQKARAQYPQFIAPDPKPALQVN